MRYKGIALSGKMRTGKDTTARILKDCDSNVRLHSFAWELKKMALDMTGLNFAEEEVKLKHRKFLIMLGQTLREYDGLYWVKVCMRRIDWTTFPVITDLRFKNEAEYLRKRGFMLIRLNASPAEIRRRGGQVLEDKSETDLDDWNDWDLVVDTDGRSPQKNAEIILSVLRKSNSQTGILDALLDMPRSELQEVMTRLHEEGKL